MISPVARHPHANRRQMTEAVHPVPLLSGSVSTIPFSSISLEDRFQVVAHWERCDLVENRDGATAWLLSGWRRCRFSAAPSRSGVTPTCQVARDSSPRKFRGCFQTGRRTSARQQS